MSQSGKKILVTGACGFIGSSFVRQALAKGYEIVVLDALTYAGHKENIQDLLDARKLELAIGDIADPKLVAELFQKHRFDGVINFAAESHVDRSITGPSAFIQTNILGTFNLLEKSFAHFNALDEAGKKRFRFLQVSTDEVYGSLGATGKFSETTAYAPNSPYSASKASADLLVRAWHHTYGLPTITTNTSNNYGPRQFPEKLIPHMIFCALNGKPLPVYGDGGNIRDWVHVDDHSAGVLLAFEKGVLGETYCLGGNAERNNLDVVRTICQELDSLKPRADGKSHETSIQFVKDRLGHDRRYAIDDTKAQRELGFKRQFNFEQGLANTIRWYLENQAWVNAVTAGGKKL